MYIYIYIYIYIQFRFLTCRMLESPFKPKYNSKCILVCPCLSRLPRPRNHTNPSFLNKCRSTVTLTLHVLKSLSASPHPPQKKEKRSETRKNNNSIAIFNGE